MAKIPSIALIPSGYKATKIYSVLPVDGGGDFTFDRGTSTDQTRVNKNGLIENVDQDVPRLDYLDGGCPSLLLEPATTNLITYSEALSNWTNINNVTVTDNSIISPNGSLSASRINETATNSVHRLFLNPTVANAKHTYSVFLKKGTRTWAFLRLDGATTDQRTWFDLENGVLGTVDADHIASIDDFGNGWYRCTVTIAGSTYDTTPLAILGLANANGVITYLGDVNEFIYAWGAQLEEQSYATSYVPTSGSTETRAAETCNGAGTTAEINSQEGVLYVELKALSNVGGNRELTISDGSTANRLIIQYRDTSNIRIIYATSLGDQYDTGVLPINAVQYNKIAVKYKLNDFAFYLNGIKIDFSDSGNVLSPNTFNELSFDGGTGGNPFYGRVKKLSVYDSALNDSQLETLTGFGSFSEMASYLSYS
jgi:hypothetical protein